MSMRRQTGSILVVVVGIFLTISLSRDLQLLLSARDRIEREHEEVGDLEEEQQELAQRLEEVVDDDFVEKEARDKLLMARPGEVVIVLPDEVSEFGGGEEFPGLSSSSELGERQEDELGNWEKWAQVFGFY